MADIGARGSVGELTPVITGATWYGGTGGATAGCSGSVAASAGKIRDVVKLAAGASSIIAQSDAFSSSRSAAELM